MGRGSSGGRKQSVLFINTVRFICLTLKGILLICLNFSDSKFSLTIIVRGIILEPIMLKKIIFRSKNGNEKDVIPFYRVDCCLRPWLLGNQSLPLMQVV